MENPKKLGVYTETTTHGLALQDLFNYMVMTEPYENNPSPFLETAVESGNSEGNQNNASELAEELYLGIVDDYDNNEIWDNNYSTLPDEVLEYTVCRDNTTNEQKVITQRKTTESCGYKLTPNMYKGIESDTDIDTETDTDTDTESERDSSETESTDNPNDYISDELLYAYAQSIQDLLNQTPETKPNDERKLSSLETGVDSVNNEVKQNNPSELAEQLHAGNAGDCDNNKTSDNNYSTLSDKLLENNVCRDSTTFQQNEQKVITQMKTTETCENKLSLNSNTDIDTDTDTESERDSSETESTDNPNAYEQSIQDMITLMKMTKPNDESKSPSSLETGIDSGNNEMIQNKAPELAEKLHVGNAENNLRRKKTTNQRKKQKADTEQITTEPFGSKLSPFLDRLIKSVHIKEFESDSSESESSEALDESNVCRDNNTYQQKEEKVDTEQITNEPFGNKLPPYLDTDIKSENIREYKIDSVKDLVDVANENYIHDSCDNKFQKSPQKHSEQHDYAGLPAYEQSIQDMITLMKMTKPNDESKSPSSLETGIDSGNNEMIQNKAPELAGKLHVGNAENNLRRKKTTNQRKKQKADTEQITTEPFGSKLSPFLDRLIKSGHIKEFESDSSESESSEALDESNICRDNNTDQQKEEKVDTEQITTEPFGYKSPPYLDTDIKSENIREYKIDSVKDLVDVANENYIHDSCDNKFQKSPQKHSEQHDYAGLPAYEQSIQDMITLMKMTKPNDESKSPSSLETGIDSGNNEMIQNNTPELAEELHVGNAGDCDKRNAGEYEKNETSDNSYLTLPDQFLKSNVCRDNNSDQQKEEKVDTEQITTEPFGNKLPPYLDADIKSENIREYKIDSVKDLVDVANENYIYDSCDNKFQKSPQKHTEHRVYADLTAYEQSIQDMITLMKMTKPNDESKSPSSLETGIDSGNNEMIQNNTPELAEELHVGNAGDCDKRNAGEYEKNETSDNKYSTLLDQLLEINVCSDNDTSPQKKQKVLTQKKKKKHWRITLPSYLRNDVKSGRIKVFESDSSSDDECLEELTKNRASSPKELNAEVESEKSYENKQSSSDDNVDSSSSSISLTSDVSDEEAASESTGDKKGNKRKVTQTKSKAAKKMKRIIIEDSSDSESSSCFSYTTTEEECKANNMVKTKFIPPPAWLKPKYDCADMRLPELFLYLKRKLRAIDAEIKKFLKKSKKKQFRTRELKWKIRNIILDMKKVDDMSYSLAHYSIPVNFLRKVNENLACGLPVLSNIQRPIPEMTLHSKLCKVFLKCGWIFLKRTFPEEGYKCSLYRQIRK
ncbi:uncharacterized protein LOC119686683 isoform X2 [Teleopsis dalmanni]|uniref:uncharacterized protein LOC119686683 isoform X2 n=1 Tax=Teleopsis dalmanni TaxID=139649 RepID=UPI0018CE260F|nr:uncharacterized protein LOC119686683 isoform X2 [Teleopsis dalmanni]